MKTIWLNYLISIFFSLCASKASIAQVSLGKTAPKISYTHIFNGIHKNIEMKDKFIILDFWATWCAPCLASVPHLNNLKDHFKDNNDLIFVAMTDENKNKVEPLLQRFLFKSYVMSDTTQQTQGLFNIRALPTTILIDNNGIIKWIGTPENLTIELLNSFTNGTLLPTESHPNPDKKSATHAKRFREVFDNDSIHDYFELIKHKDDYEKKYLQKMSTTSFSRFSINDRLVNVITQLLNCSESQLNLPKEEEDLIVSYCYKKDNLKKGDDVSGILLEKIINKLNISYKTTSKPHSCLTIEVIDVSKLKESINNQNRAISKSSVSDDNRIIAINNSKLETLRDLIEKTYGIPTLLENIDDHLKLNYDLTVHSSSIEELNSSLNFYGLSVRKIQQVKPSYHFRSNKTSKKKA